MDPTPNSVRQSGEEAEQSAKQERGKRGRKLGVFVSSFCCGAVNAKDLVAEGCRDEEKGQVLQALELRSRELQLSASPPTGVTTQIFDLTLQDNHTDTGSPQDCVRKIDIPFYPYEATQKILSLEYTDDWQQQKELELLRFTTEHGIDLDDQRSHKIEICDRTGQPLDGEPMPNAFPLTIIFTEQNQAASSFEPTNGDLPGELMVSSDALLAKLAALEELPAKYESLQQQHHSLRLEHQALQNDHATWRDAAIAAQTDLQNRGASDSETTSKQHDECVALQQRCEMLHEELQEIQKARELEAEHVMLQQKYNALLQEHESLANSSDRSELLALQQEHASVSLECAGLKRAYALQQADLRAHAEVVQNYEALQQELEDVKSQSVVSRSMLSHAHDALNQDIESLKQQNELLRLNAVGSVPIKEHSALKQLYDALKYETRGTARSGQGHHSEQERGLLKQQLGRLQQEHSLLNQKLGTLQTHVPQDGVSRPPPTTLTHSALTSLAPRSNASPSRASSRSSGSPGRSRGVGGPSHLNQRLLSPVRGRLSAAGPPVTAGHVASPSTSNFSNFSSDSPLRGANSSPVRSAWIPPGRVSSISHIASSGSLKTQPVRRRGALLSNESRGSSPLRPPG